LYLQIGFQVSAAWQHLIEHEPLRDQEEGTREKRCLYEAEEKTRQERSGEAMSKDCGQRFVGNVYDASYLVVSPVREDITPHTIIQAGK